MSVNLSSRTTLLAPEVIEEIATFERYLNDSQTGKMDPLHFKKFRLNNGVYGIRNEENLHMIRIKCKYGIISADQLDVVADITQELTRTKLAHVTTRQAIQIHHVPIAKVSSVMRRLNECGLTTREACGNTVRNVTATPYAGLLPDEIFDVLPYAEVLFQHYLRNPICQNFPRKFKIALFGGGQEDVAYTAIHDIGLVAAVRKVGGKEEKGFRIYVGGGLGANPQASILLEDFTPMSELFPTCDAVVHIFDRHGDRKDKFHARLKFVVRKHGEEVFKKMVLDERVAVKITAAGGWKWNLPAETVQAPPKLPQPIDATVPPEAGFELWRKTNVQKQKHPGYSVVTVVTPLGDIDVKQMKDLGNLARKFNGGQLRTMVQQNFVMPFIKDEHLVALHKELKATGLATAGALKLSDITRCPGADTCQIAVTKSRGLAGALAQLFTNGLAKELDLDQMNIKISGCTNSCGQHHIGNIGFFGTYRKINGHEVPHYQLLIGGDAREGHAQFGKPIAALPAKRVPEAVKHLVALFKAERNEGESFVDAMARLGKERLKIEVEPFRSLPDFANNKDLYFEWGENHEFKAEIGEGECAA